METEPDETARNRSPTPRASEQIQDVQDYKSRSPAVDPAGMKNSMVEEMSKDPFPDRFQRLGKMLGKGANKEVFLAFDTEQNRDVAWNRVARHTLSQADHRVLQKEIEMMDKADHPNIIKYLAWWDTENYFVFITDFFNMSLKQFIQERNVAVNSVKTWTLQILEGLIHLHECNIIHRDIKCDNVFINQKTGNVVIGDLGLSRNADVGALNRSMSMVGTVPFMAPEQLNLDDRTYGPKVDIYALGMTVLEMIAGEYPFEECNALPYIIKNIIDDKPPKILMRLRDGPAKEFILLCLIRDPADRPSAEGLRQHTWFDHNKDNFPVASLMISEPEPSPAHADAFSPALSATLEADSIHDTTPTPSAKSPEPPESVKFEEVESNSEDLENRKFEQSITTMKNLSEFVRDAQRNLLREDIQQNMKTVDIFVENFVNGSIVAHRSSFQDGALEILQEWEEKREFFQKWSLDMEDKLQERGEQIKIQREKLSASRIQMESLELSETDIRKQINGETRKQEDLNTRQDDIDAKIAELEEQKQQFVAEFDASKTISLDLDTELSDVIGKKNSTENEITEMDAKLQEVTDDDSLKSDQEKHNQYSTWRESVEKVMNEIQKARELEWKKWGPQEILDWICRLDQGSFRVYKEKLSVEIHAKIENGEDMLFLLQDQQTIRELGVTKIRHRNMLVEHIKRLNRNNPSKDSATGENPNV